ncbi:hypothetical protein BJX99DRAFT_200201 [Aspergillus californicus]
MFGRRHQLCISSWMVVKVLACTVATGRPRRKEKQERNATITRGEILLQRTYQVATFSPLFCNKAWSTYKLEGWRL